MSAVIMPVLLLVCVNECVTQRRADDTTGPFITDPLIIFMKFNYCDTDRWSDCQRRRSSFVSISRHVSPEVATAPRLSEWKVGGKGAVE